MSGTATVQTGRAFARRHFVTGLGIGQIASWGTLYYAYPLIGEAMGRDLGWSKSEVFGAATIGLLLAAVAAYPVGVAIDRGHGRVVMAGSSVAAAALFAAWSQVTDLVAFYVIVALLGALQSAVLYEPAFAVVARRVGPLNARAGITSLTLWGGFASTVFVPVTQLLLDHLGWRGALMALAGVNLAVCAAAYALVIDPAADAPLPPRRPDALPSRKGPLRLAMEIPAFWFLCVAFTAYAATFSAFTFHLYPLLVERGLATSDVVAAMMVIGPAQVLGRILIWRLAPRSPVRVIGATVVLAFPVALLVLWLAPTTLAVAVGVAGLYGLANGIMTIVRGMAIPEMLTREAYGALNGALAAPGTIAKALAPGAAAVLWQMSGSYDAVLAASIIGSCVLVAGFWTAAAVARHTD
ncbi:MFS transporter [Chthonobacter rhizosphaerae]|uniref:MFS transporter n=1 Tax=Chthonobacter rhizosphaerae TaxID=2735553 RepID=UPI0015EF8E40|nr:MFS transporter [Chthonobacter rhizosphaerae]